MWVAGVKCSITKNNSGSFSASHSDLLTLCSMKFPFYLSHSFPVFAWGMCMVLALCHEGTTNKRYSKSKGNCQVRDRSKVLQGMTSGCSLPTTGHMKIFCLSFLFCLSLFVFASAPTCLHSSPSYLCIRAQPQAFRIFLTWSVIVWLTAVC